MDLNIIMQNIRVSVVVVTYNSSKYVLETLESIKEQDYPNIELIVSDDCSTDNTFELVNQWIEENNHCFCRALSVQTEKNGGICVNYNRGLKEVRGEWVKYIAGDDILMPNCISTFVSYLNKSKDKIMICGLVRFSESLRNAGVRILPLAFNAMSVKGQEEFFVKNGTIIPGPTLFLETETLRKNGGFEECYPFIEDYPLCMKYLSKGYHINLVNDYLIYYRVYPESVSRSNTRFTTSIFAAIDYYAPKAALRNGMLFWWYHYKVNSITQVLPKKYIWIGYLMRCVDIINIKRKYMKYSIKEILYYFFYRLPATVKGKYIYHNLVKVHWGRGMNNFGDCLSPDILKYFGLTPVFVSNILDSDIILAGSILQWISSDYKGIILGTGGDDVPYSFPKAKVLAVRGKLTHKNFERHCDNNNFFYGDPGLLMSYVYPERVEHKYELGIIPHFVDLNTEKINNLRSRYKNNPNVLFISPLGSPKDVIRNIKSCRHIVSSSLHGLIVADSFHIPNCRFVDRNTMPTSFYDYKFEDYYSSLDLDDVPCISITGDETLEELITTTTIKNVEKVEELKMRINSLMLEVVGQFKK